MSNSNHTRGFLPLGVSRKRSNDSETGLKTGPGGFKRPSRRIPPSSTSLASAAPTANKQQLLGNSNPNPNPNSNSNPNPKKVVVYDNKLLAGHMAREVLTQGTLFGKRAESARAEAIGKLKSNATDGAVKLSEEKYAEVANLLKNDGTHIPGIFNPTQLARWLQQM